MEHQVVRQAVCRLGETGRRIRLTKALEMTNVEGTKTVQQRPRRPAMLDVAQPGRVCEFRLVGRKQGIELRLEPRPARNPNPVYVPPQHPPRNPTPRGWSLNLAFEPD